MTGKKRISLFVTCLVDNFYPEVAEATVAVLEKLGFTVDCPEGQTCCGQPAFNAGYRDEARQAARHFIKVFADAEVVVAPSGSCVYMIRNHYPLLFEKEPLWQKKAREIAGKTFELTEYLVDQARISDLEISLPERVTYHDSCHLSRGLGIAAQPRALLKAMRGIEFIELPENRCCGFGGAFAVKYPEISTAMVNEKVDQILATGAAVVTGCDMGCLMNIEGRLQRIGSAVRCLHIARLLAETEIRP